MRSLYLRIWLTVIATLALFALVSGLLWQRHFDAERAQIQAAADARVQSWGELLEHALPPASADAQTQRTALLEWSERLRVPLALDDVRGQRIAEAPSYTRRMAREDATAYPVRLDDGRQLWLARRSLRHGPPGDGLGPEGPPLRDSGPAGDGPLSRGDAPHPLADQASGPPSRPGGDPDRSAGPHRVRGEGPDGLRPPLPLLPPLPFDLPRTLVPLVLMLLLFVAVAAGAYPVVRRLTRRLEALKAGVEAFGAGDLSRRVDDRGRDEVAAVAATFNRSAERVQQLVRSHQNLLANASHELRSPLARLKMAVEMVDAMPESERDALRHEIHTNIRELDALVEEVLLASRLDAGAQNVAADDPVDLLGLAVEEATRVGAEIDASAVGHTVELRGSERLLRRAVRNLLENARRYGGDEVLLRLSRQAGAAPGADCWQVEVLDRGPGVPVALRERIFEAFYRLPGHAEREGGVGLGLSLVRQIAERHGGRVTCTDRDGGGSRFVLSLPRHGGSAAG
ncbi:MAG: hypothetical protein RL223_2083 [Pseudomonadota bacterium]|jgi:signal transduction histidine kinase